jgi:hypothetical protein
MLSKLTIALSMSLLVPGFASESASAETLPDRAIVDGRHVQPRANQFDGAHSPSDLPSREVWELTRLYYQLLDASALTGTSHGAAQPSLIPHPEVPQVAPLPEGSAETRAPFLYRPGPAARAGTYGLPMNPGPVTGYGPGGLAQPPGAPSNPPFHN